mgnify:CR=1 FL=1
MSNIVKHEQNEIYINENSVVIIPTKLPISRQNRELYLSNKNFPKIAVIDDKNVVVKDLHVTINRTIMDKGVNMPPEEITYLTQTVTDDIMRNFSHFTLEEVRLACYYGVRGELGEYYGINPTTFYQWFKRFKWELIPKTNKAIEKFLPKPKEIVRQQREVDESILNTLMDVYFELVTEGTYNFYDFGSIAYNLLDELGIIPFTTEQKIELMSESRVAFRKTVLNKNRKLTLKDREVQKIDTTRVFKELDEQSNSSMEHQVRVGAKRLAIRKFLYELAEEEIDLKELITSKMAEKKYDDE